MKCDYSDYHGKSTQFMIADEKWDIFKMNIPCKRVLVKALPSNADTIWLAVDSTARENFGYPLMAEDSITFPIDRLDRIELYFKNAADKLAILYEVE